MATEVHDNHLQGIFYLFRYIRFQTCFVFCKHSAYKKQSKSVIIYYIRINKIVPYPYCAFRYHAFPYCVFAYRAFAYRAFPYCVFAYRAFVYRAISYRAFLSVFPDIFTITSLFVFLIQIYYFKFIYLFAL